MKTMSAVMAVLLMSASGGGKDNSLAFRLISGPNYAYSLRAPKNWVLDESSGDSQGFNCVFYPASGSWEKSDLTMYSIIATKDSVIRTIQDQINLDLSNYRNGGLKNVKAIKAGSTVTGDGKDCQIYEFTGDHWDTYERVGFIDEDKVIVILVISSRDRNGLSEGMSKFNEVAESYHWISNGIKPNHLDFER
jgi:hypothetical protein